MPQIRPLTRIGGQVFRVMERIQLQHGDIKSAAYQLTHYRSIERPECS